MSRAGERGLSVVEVLVALVVLTAGLLLLAGGSGAATRELTRSRFATQALAMAEARLDLLRSRAASTTPPCTSPLFSSASGPVAYEGVTLTWQVPEAGAARIVRALVTYPAGPGRTRTDTLVAVIGC